MAIHDQIRVRAYELYDADPSRGGVDKALDDWLTAEMEVLIAACRAVSTGAPPAKPSLKVHYINCFNIGDVAEPPLREELEAWRSEGHDLACEEARDANELRTRIDRLWWRDDVPDVLIIGGHGHDSLSGFWVRNDPLRWQDLAFLLREQTAAPWSLIFYSCNGGYPGMAHVFGGTNGIDFAFGPRIQARACAMAKATIGILAWKVSGGGDVDSAKALVDLLNSWATDAYSASDEMFLRVNWGEGRGTRHPDVPNEQNPVGEPIPLRGWGELCDDA